MVGTGQHARRIVVSVGDKIPVNAGVGIHHRERSLRLIVGVIYGPSAGIGEALNGAVHVVVIADAVGHADEAGAGGSNSLTLGFDPTHCVDVRMYPNFGLLLANCHRVTPHPASSALVRLWIIPVLQPTHLQQKIRVTIQALQIDHGRCFLDSFF
jgi:hypothetical protein